MYPLRLLRTISKMRPHMVHVQFGPYGKVYGGLFGEPMLLLLILIKALGIKTTMTLHSTWMSKQVKERVKGYRAIGRLSILAPAVFRVYMRLLDLGTSSVQLSTVKIDSTLRERFLEEWSFPSRKTLEIPMPCRLPQRVVDRGQALGNLGLSGKKVILVFGFIRRGKGLETALLAMNNVHKVVRDSVLLVAGTPLDKHDLQYLTELHESASSLSLNDVVRFDTKFIPEQEVPTYMSAASVILLPYVESVGASGPAHGAAGYGVPIVASNTGHHMRESLGGALVLFQAGWPEDMAEKLVHVLSDTDSAAKIGERLRQYARTETWALAIRRTMSNYRITMTLP
jgi:glycosyltransferase involved in cell wall biosynthesis